MDPGAVSAAVRKIIAAEGTTQCFAELRNMLVWHGVQTLDHDSWKTADIDARLGPCLSTLAFATSDLFPSPREHNGTLRGDLWNICQLGKFQSSPGFGELRSFLDAVIAGLDSEVTLWERLYTYVKIRFQTTTCLDEADDDKVARINALHQQWTSNFIGQSLFALKAKLTKYHARFENNTHLYARIMSIVQSSGTGKSRLVNELGGSAFGICFTLRENGSSGYPPGDPEVVKFLKADLKLESALKHARLVCFLGAAVTIATHKFPTVGAIGLWRDKMAPAPEIKPVFDRSIKFSEVMAGIRSQFRKDFCSQVVKLAESTFATFMDSSDEWITEFSKGEFNKLKETRFFQNTLGKPAADLLDVLPDSDVPGCKAFFVVDEVSLLNNFDSSLFLALRRMLRLLKALPIWTFLLDTTSGLATLAPADEHDGSSRVIDGGLERVNPFFSLSMDVEFNRRLEDPELRTIELQKPLSEYGTVAHMSLLGRPLWAIYRGLSDSEVRLVARVKILGGRRVYDPNSRGHVFALLASRVCLSPCTRNTAANELSRTAVSLHLRLISSIDLKSGRTLTVTPSEPLVSEAAAHCLFENWPTTIQVFTEQLLAPYLLDAGLGGELYSRIVFIMGKDATAEDAKLKDANCQNQSGLSYAQPVMLWDFLLKLFGGLLDNLPPEFSTAFKGARVNFTHFVSTDTQLSKSYNSELLHLLMYSHAALQLVGNQAYWDHLIPVYLGDPAEPFDSDRLTCLAVQIKNRDHRKSKFAINLDDYETLSIGKNPMLFLQLELGLSKTELDHMVDGHVYAIRVTGKGRSTYSFLTKNAESALDSMLTQLGPCFDGPGEKGIVGRYHRFRRSEWLRSAKRRHEESDRRAGVPARKKKSVVVVVEGSNE